MKARRILYEKTQRFLRGWWRTEEGVYINKEQRFMFLQLAHVGHGVGVGWGGDVNVQLKSHTYVMLRSTPTLT